MSDITQRSTLKNKKRYIAIAALAGLVATGGVIGATVTSESTIANNQVTIAEEPATDAVVSASGTPLALSFTEGADVGKGPLGLTTFTLTNTGETDATVKVLEVADIPRIPIIPGATGNPIAYLRVAYQGGSADATKLLFSQKISSGTPTAYSLPITVPAGGSVELDAYVQFSNGTTQFGAYDATFDLQFDYVNKQ